MIRTNYHPTKYVMDIRRQVASMVMNEQPDWKERIRNAKNKRKEARMLIYKTINGTEHYDILTKHGMHDYDKVAADLIKKSK